MDHLPRSLTWDKVVAVWDSLTSSETQDESLARQREERHQKTVASGETTVKEDPNAPSTKSVQPQDPDDANVAEVTRDRQFLARAQGEAAEKAKPVVQTAVELAAPTATAAATLATGKTFYGEKATPEEMKQAKETLAASAAAPAVVGAVAKYGGKLLAWGKKKGGALVNKLLGRAEDAAAAGLDWNAVVPAKGKYAGQSRPDHVRLHNVDSPAKARHGVFFDDGVKVTDEAWERAQQLGLTPDKTGKVTVPMQRQVGVAGGVEGSAAYVPLNSVTIQVVPGTNKIITAYPDL